jgi:hypothetical protein
VATPTTAIDLQSEALIRRTRRAAGVVLALVAALLLIGALVPMRYVGQMWSEGDVLECQASVFVEHAAQTGGQPAAGAAMRGCVEHRRAKRWGPWGAFGNADDASKYNGAED